jgi:hypothetical protein
MAHCEDQPERLTCWGWVKWECLGHCLHTQLQEGLHLLGCSKGRLRMRMPKGGGEEAGGSADAGALPRTASTQSIVCVVDKKGTKQRHSC